MQKQKTFLIINLSYFGDVLLTNSLCRNLKKEYPDCKVVFLVNTPFYEAAKYQDGVDDVICMNKRKEHKGLLGLLKFVFFCKYRNKIDATFVIYSNTRGILLSFFLGSKRRISSDAKVVKYLLTDIVIEGSDVNSTQDINGNFIKALTNRAAEILPIKYNVEPESNFLANRLIDDYKGKDLIGLCCVSKAKEKDMPIETAIGIINRLNIENKTVLLFGNGNIAREYADNLKKRGCTKFVDLTNVTSVYDLANIIAVCKGVVSVDTGTMHLSYAVKCPAVCVFYKKENIDKWAPNPDLYNVCIEKDDYSADNLCAKLFELIQK